MELCSRSAGETEALGARLAELLNAGDVVVLTGDLGTGKTVLAKGIGRGLGVTEPIVSPTFTIVREYEGDIPLQHLDVYRLDHLQEAIDLGLDELLDGDAVTVIEWGEAVGALLPPDRLEVAPDPAATRGGRRRHALDRAAPGRAVVGSPPRGTGRSRGRAGAGSDAAPGDRHRDTARQRCARTRRPGHRRREPRRRPSPRGAARAGDRLPVPRAGRGSAPARRDRRGARPRPVHRSAGRRDHRAGHGAELADPGDRGAVARPHRVPAAVHDAHRRAGRRRAPARGLLRVLPTGPRWRAAHHGVRGGLAGRPRRGARGARRGRAARGTARCATRSSSGSWTMSSWPARGPRSRARPRSSSSPPRATSGRSSARRTRCIRYTFAGATRRSSGSGGVSSGDRAAAGAAGGAPRADAPSAPALGAGHRDPGLPAAVDDVAVPERARSARHAGVLRRQGRTGRRGLRRADGHRRRGPRHDDRGRPRVAPPSHRDAPPARGHPRGDRARGQRADARGAREQRRRAGDVPPVRVRRGRDPQGLLRGDQRGCARDVGPRHRHARARGAARHGGGHIDGETIIEPVRRW